MFAWGQPSYDTRSIAAAVHRLYAPFAKMPVLDRALRKASFLVWTESSPGSSNTIKPFRLVAWLSLYLFTLALALSTNFLCALHFLTSWSTLSKAAKTSMVHGLFKALLCELSARAKYLQCHHTTNSKQCGERERNVYWTCFLTSRCCYCLYIVCC